MALVVMLAVIANIVLPKQYTASAAVLIDVKSPDPIAGVILPGMMAPGYIATQVDIIKSERVARSAAKFLKLSDNVTLRQQWQDQTKGQGSFDSWLSEVLLKNLDVRPSRESSVISIAYTAADPHFAAALANAFVESYIQTTLELRTEPAKQYRRLFDEQAKLARVRLEAAQARLTAYQRESGLLATDERLDVENARLAELSSQLVSLQTLSAESSGRKQLAGANSAEVLNNGVVAALKADLSRSEAKLKELGARYGAAHPQVVELQASVNELRTKIDAEIVRVTSSAGVTNSIAQYREAQIRQALEAQRAKVLKLKEQRSEAAVLIRDVEAAQRDHEAITARFNLTSIESQSNQTNVSIVRHATPPSSYSSPKTLLNLVIAVFIGSMLSIGAALFFELLDRRMRSEDDVVAVLRLPMLGAIPNARKEDGLALAAIRSHPHLAKRALPELMAPKT